MGSVWVPDCHASTVRKQSVLLVSDDVSNEIWRVIGGASRIAEAKIRVRCGL